MLLAAGTEANDIITKFVTVMHNYEWQQKSWFFFVRIWDSSSLSLKDIVIFGLVIRIGNSVNYGKGQLRFTSKYWIGFNTVWGNEINKNTTAEGKLVRVAFTIYGFIYRVGNIPIGGIRSVQLSSRNVSISQPFVVKVLTVCFATQTSVKLWQKL